MEWKARQRPDSYGGGQRPQNRNRKTEGERERESKNKLNSQIFSVRESNVNKIWMEINIFMLVI